MSTTQVIRIREDDTEPLELTVSAEGVTNLDAMTAAVAYFKRVGTEDNHVDGVVLSVASSAARTLRFNPVGAKAGGGNAFDTPGTYQGHLKLTWTGGAVTRHPGDPRQDLRVVVAEKLG